MIITWSPLSRIDPEAGGAAAAIRYLTAVELRKTAGDRSIRLHRDPPPEALIGHSGSLVSLIDALPFEHGYGAMTLAFAKEDIPVPDFNDGVSSVRDRVGKILRLVTEVAFVGIPPELRPPFFVNTHSHTKKLEVNIVIPRMVQRPSGQIMAFNPHPPGKVSRRLWDACTDVINARYGFADPRSIDHLRLVGLPDWQLKQAAEARRAGLPSLSEPRAEIADLAVALYESEDFDDRDTLIAALEPELQERGVKVLTTSRDSVTLLGPDGHKWRMRGHVFSDAFEPNHPLHDLPELEYRDYRAGQLQRAPARLASELARRALFHSRRYQSEHPVPDPTALLGGQPLKLPPRHPGRAAAAAITTITVHLVATMTRVVARIHEFLPRSLILRTLAAADLSPFAKLRKSLELLNDRHNDAARPFRASHNHPNAIRPDRSAPDDLGAGTGTRNWGATRSVHVGALSDPGGDRESRRQHGTECVATAGRAGSAGSHEPGDHGDAAGHRDPEGMAFRPPGGSRAELMIRLQRAAEQEQHGVRLTLRGTLSGEIHLSGDGFRAELGGGQLLTYTVAHDRSADQLARILQGAGIRMEASPELNDEGYGGP